MASTLTSIKVYGQMDLANDFYKNSDEKCNLSSSSLCYELHERNYCTAEIALISYLERSRAVVEVMVKMTERTE